MKTVFPTPKSEKTLGNEGKEKEEKLMIPHLVELLLRNYKKIDGGGKKQTF